MSHFSDALSHFCGHMAGMLEGVAQVFDSTVRSGALGSQLAGAVSDSLNSVKAELATALSSEANGLHTALSEGLGSVRGDLEGLAASLVGSYNLSCRLYHTKVMYAVVFHDPHF